MGKLVGSLFRIELKEPICFYKQNLIPGLSVAYKRSFAFDPSTDVDRDAILMAKMFGMFSGDDEKRGFAQGYQSQTQNAQ